VFPAALLAVVIALAGCSSGDKKDKAQPTKSATPPAVTTGGPNGSPTPASSLTGGPGANPDLTLCRLLTADDLKGAGLAAATAPDTTNVTDVEAFCVYGTDIELDVFVSKTADDATDVYDNTLATAGTASATGVVTGADASAYGSNASRGLVGVVVRKGKLVFLLSVPANTANAKNACINLATIALGRSGGIA